MDMDFKQLALAITAIAEEKNLPEEIREGKIECYVEPFIGSGALYKKLF